MKKLLLALTMILSVMSLSAQDFTVTKDGAVVENGASYNLVGQGNTAWEEFILGFEVTTNADMGLIAEKVELQVVEGTNNSICLGLCYSPSVYVSPVVEFTAGVPQEYSMHYMYNESMESVAGLEQIMQYYLYTETNPDDKFIINITFKYSLDGVEDYSSSAVFSNAYPMPASDVVNFDYNFASNVDAQIAIFNMMGQEVMRNEINGMSGKASINVSDLADGVYFYSLIINGKTEKSNKLIIRK